MRPPTLQQCLLLLSNHASVIYSEFFRASCRKNYALDRKMIAPFRMALKSSTTMQSLQSLVKIEQRVPVVGMKIGCLCVFICHAPFCQRSVRSEGHTLNKYCVTVYG